MIPWSTIPTAALFLLLAAPLAPGGEPVLVTYPEAGLAARSEAVAFEISHTSSLYDLTSLSIDLTVGTSRYDLWPGNAPLFDLRWEGHTCVLTLIVDCGFLFDLFADRDLRFRASLSDASHTVTTDRTYRSPAHFPRFTLGPQGEVRVAGEPFLPIFTWDTPLRWGSRQPPEIDRVRALGANCAMNNPGEVGETNAVWLNGLEARGMYGVAHYGPDAASIAGHPALLAFMGNDEPDINSNAVQPSALATFVQTIKTNYPDKLALINFSGAFYNDSSFTYKPSWMGSSWRQTYTSYFNTPGLDIVSFDFYPVTGWNRPDWAYIPGRSIPFVRTYYASSKPVWSIVECNDQRLSWVPQAPAPTPEEQDFEAWSCLVNGSRAIGYFTVAFNPFQYVDVPAANAAAMTALNAFASAHQKILLAPSWSETVTATETSGRDFEFATRSYRGKLYLLVANADMSRATESITFSLPATRSIRTLEELFSQRPIAPATPRSFTDTLEPLGIRMFELDLR